MSADPANAPASGTRTPVQGDGGSAQEKLADGVAKSTCSCTVIEYDYLTNRIVENYKDKMRKFMDE